METLGDVTATSGGGKKIWRGSSPDAQPTTSMKFHPFPHPWYAIEVWQRALPPKLLQVIETAASGGVYKQPEGDLPYPLLRTARPLRLIPTPPHPRRVQPPTRGPPLRGGCIAPPASENYGNFLTRTSAPLRGAERRRVLAHSVSRTKVTFMRLARFMPPSLRCLHHLLIAKGIH